MHRRWTRTLACLALGAFLGGPSARAEEAPTATVPPTAPKEAPAEREFPLETVDLLPKLASQRTDLTWFRPIGTADGDVGSLAIGDHQIPLKRTKAGLLIAKAPGKVPSQRVIESETVRVAVTEDGAKREIALHIRRVPGGEPGAWQAAVVSGRRLSIGIAAVDLVDLDGDGQITPGAGDGYRSRRSPLTLPLGQTLIVGADRLTISRVEGDRLFATVERLAETSDQRIALATINKARLRDGLPPVVLDPELSAACTAHAAYLWQNGWSGYTNPHSEEEGKPGYTEAGHVAARSSVIMGEPHTYAIAAYLTTVYHRAGFTDPFLERVGISTLERVPRRFSGTPWISVIDVQSGSPPREEPDSTWKDPILVPADGSIGFETDFCGRGEVPAPTPQPSIRGNPLTVLFARWDHGVIDFEGELVLLEDGKEIPVPTLVAEPQQGSRLLGIVPEDYLKADSTYRVTYVFGRYDEPEQRASATFRTR
jgi:hypothetical protein